MSVKKARSRLTKRGSVACSIVAGAIVLFSASCGSETKVSTVSGTESNRGTQVDMSQFEGTPMSVEILRGERVGILMGGRVDNGAAAFTLDPRTGEVETLPPMPAKGWVVLGAVKPAGPDLIVGFIATCGSEPVETDSGTVCSNGGTGKVPDGDPDLVYYVLRGESWQSLEDATGAPTTGLGLSAAGDVVALTSDGAFAVGPESVRPAQMSDVERTEMRDCSLLGSDGVRVVDGTVSFVDSAGKRSELPQSAVWERLTDGAQQAPSGAADNNPSCAGLRSDGPWVTSTQSQKDGQQRVLNMLVPDRIVDVPVANDQTGVEIGGGLDYLYFGSTGGLLTVTDGTSPEGKRYDYAGSRVLTADHAMLMVDLSAKEPFIERIIP